MSYPETEEEWLECLNLPEYIKMIPSGHIVPIVGPEIWIDGNGTKMNASEYQTRYGIDPAVAWKAIKEYRARAGKKEKLVML